MTLRVQVDAHNVHMNAVSRQFFINLIKCIQSSFPLFVLNENRISSFPFMVLEIMLEDNVQCYV